MDFDRAFVARGSEKNLQTKIYAKEKKKKKKKKNEGFYSS
jgi:hypothetical protein